MYTQDLHISRNSFWLFQAKLWLEPAWAEGYLLAHGQGKVEQANHRKNEDAAGLWALPTGRGSAISLFLFRFHFPLWMSARCSWPLCLSLTSAAARYQRGSGFVFWFQCEESQRQSLWLVGLGLNVQSLTNQIDWAWVQCPTLDQSDWLNLGWLSNPGPINCVLWRCWGGRPRKNMAAFSQATGCCSAKVVVWCSGQT